VTIIDVVIIIVVVVVAVIRCVNSPFIVGLCNSQRYLSIGGQYNLDSLADYFAFIELSDYQGSIDGAEEL